MSAHRGLLGLAAFLLACLGFAPQVHADGSLHTLWELHGQRNTVYLLGSIHVLRPGDYPLAQPVLDAYARSSALVMEVDLDDLAKPETAADLLAESRLPEGKTLPAVLGEQRYARASTLARDAGAELAAFDGFAPWFAAEAVSQLQLAKLGFTPESGVEMYFLGKAHEDGKGVTGLETVHDQLSLFGQLSLDTQADYLLASLEEAHALPSEVNALVNAWKHGDMRWFENELQQEFGNDPRLYESLITGRNRKWVPKIEALLTGDRNALVIVGTGHLVGRGSVIELLKKDGIGATQK
ncbi:MAG TPA: TraB/GumN family protein [Steroidobacteraceae bacterium]|jgi:hypothetical protein|nr:TraB/GumN family protein [Steroidobacteraceae bacterium]